MLKSHFADLIYCIFTPPRPPVAKIVNNAGARQAELEQAKTRAGALCFRSDLVGSGLGSQGRLVFEGL